MEDYEIESEPLVRPKTSRGPPDHYYSVYFIFMFIGMACLLPWNFFITAKEYFQFKLRNTSLPADIKYNDKSVITTDQALFESYLSIVSMLTNLVFAILTTIFIRSIPLKLRMVVSFIIVAVIFIGTTALTKIDTDKWQYTFFVLTLSSAAVVMGSTAVSLASVIGLSCIFPTMYTQANMIGQSVGGTFAAVAKILSISGNGGVTDSAFGYFLTATTVTVFALVAYGLLYKLRFSRFHLCNQIDTSTHVNNEIPSYKEIVGNREYFTSIFKETWQLSFSCFMTFMVSLSCFPAICSSIQAVNYKQGDPWTDTYFSSVVCFLMFNVGDCIGRLFTGWFDRPSPRMKYVLMFFSIIRIVYIPLLLACNIQNGTERSIPIIFNHDAYPIVFILTLGISNGYLSTLSLMFAPTQVPIEQAEGVGVLMSCALTFGLTAGSLLSLLLLKLV
ncbi:hypothetical protein SNE40_016950 [Patella caerulea]|uniref:Equilibrative nucleoside transporter 3 n=1 Tax=Patella caerulea TaxID=87958 RepID=A0AAN8PKJ3_PATCE